MNKIEIVGMYVCICVVAYNWRTEIRICPNLTYVCFDTRNGFQKRHTHKKVFWIRVSVWVDLRSSETKNYRKNSTSVIFLTRVILFVWILIITGKKHTLWS